MEYFSDKYFNLPEKNCMHNKYVHVKKSKN